MRGCLQEEEQAGIVTRHGSGLISNITSISLGKWSAGVTSGNAEVPSSDPSGARAVLSGECGN